MSPLPPDTATAEISTLSLHDALPICARLADHAGGEVSRMKLKGRTALVTGGSRGIGRERRTPFELHARNRSEEHTSELQSHHDLVCRLLREKKNTKDSQKQTGA